MKFLVLQSLFLAIPFLWLILTNIQAKSNAPKPNQRKKWRKTTIQLVTNPPPSLQPENSEIPKESDNKANWAEIPVIPPRTMRSATSNEAPQEPDNRPNEANIPVKLPRAMRSATSNGGNPFRDRNADKPDELSVDKDAGFIASRSPARNNRTSDEKENYGL